MKIFTRLTPGLLLFIISCNSASSPAALIGTWHTQNAQIKGIFRSNNTYELDFDGDGNTEIKGVYSVHGSRVAMSDLQGDHACGGETIGIYRYKISDDTLIFTLIEDGCENRKNNTGAKWIKLADRRTAME
jgi:hypothetical protein